jgi:hypothetical protein
MTKKIYNETLEFRIMSSCLGSMCSRRNVVSTRNICGDATKDVLGIIHYTVYENLLSIIKDGRIISKIEALRENKSFTQVSSETTSRQITNEEFPGVFASLLLRQNIGYEYNVVDDSNIYLIFSKVLLKQKNYHLRSSDNNGILDEDAYGREYIDTAIKAMKKKLKSGGEHYTYMLSDNEIVFHNPISLAALQAIVATNDEVYTKLKKTLPEPYNSMVELTETVQDKVYNKYCDLSMSELEAQHIIDTHTNPNYCVFIHNDWKRVNSMWVPKYISPKVYPKFADNCGVSIVDLTETFRTSKKDEAALKKYYQDVNRRLKKAVTENFATTERVTPKWVPNGKTMVAKRASRAQSDAL